MDSTCIELTNKNAIKVLKVFYPTIKVTWLKKIFQCLFLYLSYYACYIRKLDNTASTIYHSNSSGKEGKLEYKLWCSLKFYKYVIKIYCIKKNMSFKIWSVITYELIVELIFNWLISEFENSRARQPRISRLYASEKSYFYDFKDQLEVWTLPINDNPFFLNC